MLKKKSLRIIIVQIINRNLGDGVIADCAEFLIKKAIPWKYRNDYIIYPYNIYSEDYDLLKHADLIIFAGGGIIKYKYEKFHIYVTNILKEAQTYNIPVLLNGVGVEDYNDEDERCRNLKDALNLDCVKTITIRDDFERMKQYYITNSDITLKAVYDPAVWLKQVYHIKKCKNTNRIGLGVVRHKIFSDNGIEAIDKDFLLEFWKEVILECERSGYEWQIFTNGLKSDEEFAIEVLEYAGYGEKIEKYKAPRLTEASELVRLISGYKAIIASRLHANIIAYTLGIPSVAPVWNDKLVFWGKKIGREECFIVPEDLEAHTTFAVLLNAMQKKIKRISCFEKRSGLKEIQSFIKKYGKRNGTEKERSQCDWNECLMATALGGKRYLYCNMNTIDTLEDSIQGGFRWLEVDVRLTSDNKLVCVNGWNKAIYDKLEITSDETNRKMKYAAFMKARYYGNYSTCDLKTFKEEISKYSNRNIVLDLGKPEKKRIETFFDQLLAILPSEINGNKIYIRLQRESDVILAQEKQVPYPIWFYLECEEELESVISFSKEKNITWITMRSEVVSREICEKAHDNHLKVCVFSANSFHEIQELQEFGVDKVSTHYIYPRYLLEMGV